ncbi:MAG: glycosyltransferase family 4 protein, partial [Actinomycetes bacterium]
MRLVLDLQATQSPEHFDRGIARYVAELALGLVDIGADIALLGLNPDRPLPPALAPRLLSHPAVGWTGAASIEAVEGDAAYVATSPMEDAPLRSILPDAVRRRGLPVVAILYDLIPLVFPDRYLRERPWSAATYRQRLDVYRVADVVLAISERTRADGIQLLGLDPGRVRVIHGGVASFFRPPSGFDDPPPLPGPSRPYVLCVGGDDPRKNLEGLIRAWGCMGADHQERFRLVIVCKLRPEARDALLQEAAAAGIRPDSIVITGYVGDPALRSLYQHAALCVVPSRYEGLGLPVLEALACGCPTITSSTSSLPEVLQLASSTFDPDAPAAIAAAMARALGDEQLREEILERAAERLPQFTWTATAERVVAAAERLRRPVPTTPRKRRPSLAIVGPVPPSSAGPAVYTSRIVRTLRDLADVVLVDSENRRHGTIDGVPCVPAMGVGDLLRLEDSDHVLTLFGNSEHYGAGMELHRRHPSVAW